MATKARILQYKQYGAATDVLELVEIQLDSPKGTQVLVKILAAPINPVDLMITTGTYSVKPPLPAVGGNEFVGEVIAVGDQVKNLSVGTRVVLFEFGLGAWQSHAIYDESQLLAISDKIGLVDAATLLVNPGTAYRILKDFVDLAPGDVVIQNGANSAVGQIVHQLCKAWNVKSVGIVRDRPDIDELKKYLKSIGATEVFTEEEISQSTIFSDGVLPRPRLALNCVGGKSAAEVTRHLAKDGLMLTYGGISREPLIISTSAFVYDNITFRGFWLLRWLKDNISTPKPTAMMDELSKLIEEGKIQSPLHEIVPLEKFKVAIETFSKGFAGKKFILTM